MKLATIIPFPQTRKQVALIAMRNYITAGKMEHGRYVLLTDKTLHEIVGYKNNAKSAIILRIKELGKVYARGRDLCYQDPSIVMIHNDITLMRKWTSWEDPLDIDVCPACSHELKETHVTDTDRHLKCVVCRSVCAEALNGAASST